ncbi:2-oxo acid dehydrogenase subunit E2 [Salipiger sp. 1_MG-2023]|uniref:2-oxo acid dehydrogenase subunit E2 n=1 Tax=Salipiger sp. 1_MG-2023 TaxID=3062665 RepID=UPI0026E27712|nr:2-oxo acid dehydrogenase subunit E2 [Salipiger sp. 1_MG-2023]MDO6584712.1 2-oxo acid dehydrogenase subunit E2 [Salipiger sp. 1_MG-2023]
MTQTIDIHVPDIGDFSDVPVVEIPVSVGDVIAAEDIILIVESDKATLDIPSPQAGRIAAIELAEGTKVSQGTLILRLESEGSMTTPAPSKPAPAPLAPETKAPLPPQMHETGAPAHASPSVRKFARSLGVAIAGIAGTGPKGRILREDVEAFVKAELTQGAETPGAPSATAGLPGWPQVDYAKFGPVDRQPLSRIAKISGPALARNALIIPHVCNFDTADVTDLETFRKTLNAEASDAAKLTMLAFTVKAVVSALQAFPKFNASLDGDSLVVKRYWNIGVAADTPDGLVVPVIRQADQKGLREIATEMADLAGAARAGKIKPTDMQGATFTISSLGGIGGTGFTPIINAPEVAILGMTRAAIQPVWDGAQFLPRLIQPLSLSWDHRVVDGVLAARFLAHVSTILGDFRRLSV